MKLSEIKSAQSMSDSDKFVVIENGSERLITKEDLQKVFSGLSSEQRNKVAKIILSGDGTKFFNDKGNYTDVVNLFDNSQFKKNQTNKIELTDYHTHENLKNVLNKLTVDKNGVLLFDGDIIGSYALPTATDEVLGGVKVDGTTITASEDGTISSSSNYELPTATSTVLGGVRVDGDTIKINNGVISADVIGNWISGASYPVGYFVVYNNAFYQCIEANSDITWTKNKWSPIGSSGNIVSKNITEWTDGSEYVIGDLVVYENTIYKCVEIHTSTIQFDTTKWVNLTGAKGDNGISPTLSYETTSTGVTVTMTDVNGETSFDLPNGINGNDGKSAYEIAVDNNFKGTKQEWLEALVGRSGVTPHIDPETKHWMIGETDTGVLAEAQILVNTDYTIAYATFIAENWSEATPYTQTVNVPTIVATNSPIVDLKLSDNTDLWDNEEKAYANLMKIETNDGNIVAYCKNKPEIDFSIKMRI